MASDSSPYAPPSSSHTPGAAHKQSGRSGWLWIIAAVVLAWPWFFFRFTADVHHVQEATPWLVALLAGGAILGAAFLLSWAAEAFQLDVSQALAIAFLSLIAVLPEYAVGVIFAWRAADDPAQGAFALANMTGANRLLIGVGWSAVVLVTWWRLRRSSRSEIREAAEDQGQPMGAMRHQQAVGTVAMQPGQVVELAALGAATLYSFVIPFKGGIGLLDIVVLFGLFAIYGWATAKAPAEEPHLVGPAASIGALSSLPRRLVTYGLFAYAGIVILLGAEPFAEGLVSSGKLLGIDEFLLVQWLAPLASEAPEFAVALLFAWRGMANAGLRTLVASKLNQWTLLIGTLGLAYSVALGKVADLPLDARASEELLLTSAQSLFALALIANFDLSPRESLVLLGTFLIQALFPSVEVRLAMAGLFVVSGVGLIVATPSRRATLMQLPRMLREAVRPVPAAAPPASGAGGVAQEAAG